MSERGNRIMVVHCDYRYILRCSSVSAYERHFLIHKNAGIVSKFRGHYFGKPRRTLNEIEPVWQAQRFLPFKIRQFSSSVDKSGT